MRAVLSETQKEILDMLTKEYETPKRIALRRKTTVQAVYKVIRKLIKKGYLTRGFNKGLKKSQSTKDFFYKGKGKYIRLHGQEWNIKIIYKSRFYNKLPKNKVIFSDGNTIRIYKDSIEVYSNENLKFEAEDEQKATAMSFNYWQKIFNRLENKLKVTLIKEGYHNIELVNHHYAEVNNELAEEYNEKKVKLNIYSTEDGKLWFKIDHSWNLHEAETLHPETAKPDITKVKAHFNDIRDNKTYLPSEIKKNIDITNQLLFKTSENLNKSAHLITGNTTLIQRIETGFQSLQEQIMNLSVKVANVEKRRSKPKEKAIQHGLNRWFK